MIGKGLHRECYVHPDDPLWCVKVIVAGNSNENHREAKYYGLLARRGISWEMLTCFHALVATNLGEGAVFDLVRDHDGSVSATLAQYLESDELSRVYGPSLACALSGLRDYLMQNRIITMTLKSKNIVYQKMTGDSGKLVIVDNVGNSDFIPAGNYSGYLARKKISRKWRRFMYDLNNRHPGCTALSQVPAV
jgi:hypothetical protein